MALDTQTKREIRKHVLLELNSCFVKISRHYKEHGGDAEREFLQTLIQSIKECVDGATDSRQYSG